MSKRQTKASKAAENNNKGESTQEGENKEKTSSRRGRKPKEVVEADDKIPEKKQKVDQKSESENPTEADEKKPVRTRRNVLPSVTEIDEKSNLKNGKEKAKKNTEKVVEDEKVKKRRVNKAKETDDESEINENKSKNGTNKDKEENAGNLKATKKVPASESRKRKENAIDSVTSVQEGKKKNSNHTEKVEEKEIELPVKRGGRKPLETDNATKKLPVNDKKIKNKTETDLDSLDFSCGKVNKKGETYNLKICSWNVGGARAVVKKQGMEYIIKEDADIVLLQETKCTKKQLAEIMDLPGYELHMEDGTGKPGYAGVAFYTKKKPVNVTFGLVGSGCDDESRLITAEYADYFVLCAYFPNAGRKLVTMSKKLKWNKMFKSYVKKLDDQKPVIICGDLNVAHNEIDLKNPGTNEKNAGFTKEERDAMTDLLSAGFVDTFRDLYPDKTGSYTFWSYMSSARAKNSGWRLDYFLTSERIAKNICDNVMRDQVYGSDHCPIVLFINI